MLTLEFLRRCANTTYRQVTNRDLGRLFTLLGCILSEDRPARFRAVDTTILPSPWVAPSDHPEAIDTLNEMASQWSLLGDSGETIAPQDGPIHSMPGVWSNTEFVDRIKQEAALYRLQGTIVGDFLARHLDQLASVVRWTGARMPSEHEDRLNAWEASIGNRCTLGIHEQTQPDACRCGEGYVD